MTGQATDPVWMTGTHLRPRQVGLFVCGEVRDIVVKAVGQQGRRFIAKRKLKNCLMAKLCPKAGHLERPESDVGHSKRPSIGHPERLDVRILDSRPPEYPNKPDLEAGP